jgi:hypothetical protein
MMIADGLGHGLRAREAADAALGVFATDHEHAPARVGEGVHASLCGTRASVALIAVDLERERPPMPASATSPRPFSRRTVLTA